MPGTHDEDEKGQKVYRVGVFRHDHSPGLTISPWFTAHLRQFSQARGCCVHDVMATNGPEAKRAAIAAHKRGEGCSS